MKHLLLLICLLFAGILPAYQAHATINVSSSTGNSSSPHTLTFSGTYSSATSTGYATTLSNLYDGGNIGSVYVRFTVPKTGCIKIPTATSWREGSNSTVTGSLASGWHEVTSGTSVLFAVSSSSRYASPTIYYHVHSYSNVYTYSYANESQCIRTTTLTCFNCCLSPKSTNGTSTSYVSHSWTNVTTVPATCTTSGYTTSQCSLCSYTKKYDIVEATGHSYTGSCESYSSSQHKVYCSNCSEYTLENHSLVNSICSKCNYKYVSSSSGSGSGSSSSSTYVGPVKPLTFTVTAISDNLVNVTFRPAWSNVAKGTTVFYLYAGSKKVKTITNTGKSVYVFNYKVKGAAKKKYKLVVADKKNTNNKVATAAKKATKNNKTYKYSYNLNPKSTAYKSELAVHWRPKKLVKKGNTITLTGAWFSTHIVSIRNVKEKVYLYYYGADGSRITIGTKTLKASKMKAYYKKSTTFKFKLSGKKLKKVDTKNGGYLTWGAKLTQWAY